MGSAAVIVKPITSPPGPPHLICPHALEGLRRGDGTIDWSPWYLTDEEDMGQSGER